MLPNREGQRVPDVTFKIRRDNQWAEVSSADLFKGRTVALFALPGAYTPTCSAEHLPGFNRLAPVFRSRGVDDVICLSAGVHWRAKNRQARGPARLAPA
jgi:peroxiredoxin